MFYVKRADAHGNFLLWYMIPSGRKDSQKVNGLDNESVKRGSYFMMPDGGSFSIRKRAAFGLDWLAPSLFL
jgi:hypothetical protein